MAVFLVFLLLVISSATACDRCLRQGKAAYFSKPYPAAAGACGYGSLSSGFSNGNIAAAIPPLYKEGAGCGACFQIKCKNTNLCNGKGTIVTVTDLSNSNQTDFVLSSRAFLGMAKKGMGHAILGRGIVDVEYKRVPCEYKNQNLSIRVEESSKKPHYMAIKVLYQAGKTEMVGVMIGEANSPNYGYMERSYGAVWHTSNVPKGALEFRFAVYGGYDIAWISAKRVVPADWRPGVIYDLGVQITEVSYLDCPPCNDEIN